MPKPSNPPVPTGTFSDLYEAMQKRRTGDQPPGSDVQTSGRPDTQTSKLVDRIDVHFGAQGGLLPRWQALGISARQTAQ